MKTILLLFSLWDQINGSFCLWARSRALFGVCITQCVIHHKYANVVKSQRARAHQKLFEKHKSLLRKQCWFLHSVYFMSSLSLSLPLSHTHVIVFNRICHMWAVTRHTHTHIPSQSRTHSDDPTGSDVIVSLYHWRPLMLCRAERANDVVERFSVHLIFFLYLWYSFSMRFDQS